MDWLDLLAFQGSLKSLFQHHSSKASLLRCSAFFIVKHSHLYMATGKTIALTWWTFAGKITSLLFNMLSRLVIAFLPRSKHLLISWLQSPSAVILEPPQNKVCHCFHCFPIYLPWRYVKWKCCTQYASKFGKLSSGHRTGKSQFHSNPKEGQCQRMLRLPYVCPHFTC